jgi:tetratricopeptide (TPR) repeat protein
MRKTTTFATILVLVALLAAHMAWAGPTEDSDREAARIATKQATAAYNLGHYDEAASQYEEAYRRVPDPILLYNLGQSYRQADRLDKALTAYRSYLRTAPDDAPNRAKVQQWVGELEWTSDLQNKTAVLKAAQEKKRAAQVVTKPAESAEPSKAVEAEPAQPAEPAERQIQDQQARTPSVSTRPDLVTQAPAVEEPHSAASWKKWAPWVGVGITAALGVATIVEGLSANSSFNNLQGNCGKTRMCTDSQVDGVRSKATVTNVLLGLTVASAAATGVVFYFSYSGSKETAASLAWRY